MKTAVKVELLIMGFLLGVVITGVTCTIIRDSKRERDCEKRGGTYVKEICFAKGVVNE